MVRNNTGRPLKPASSVAHFVKSVVFGLRLLSLRERRLAWCLVGGMVCVSLLEMLSVAAAVPFVNIVIQPESIQTNELIRKLHQFAGSPSPASFVTYLGVAVIALMLSSALANWGILYCQNWFAASCQNRLARTLFEHCLCAPYLWFVDRNSALLSKLIYDDVALWSRGLVHRSLIMANNVFLVGVASILVVSYSQWTGIVGMLIVAGLGYTSFGLIRPVLDHFAATKRQALDQVVLMANQVLGGIKDVKLSARQTYFGDLVASAYATASKSHAELNVWQETPSRVVQVLAQITVIALALLFLNRGIPKGEMAAQLALLILVASRVVPAVSALSSSVLGLSNALPHVQEIRNTFKSIDEETHRSTAKQKNGKLVDAWREIRFEGVGYQYPKSQTPALIEISIMIGQGRSYGIVGPSAAGKSTFVDLLVGLLEPTSGHIWVDDSPLQDIDLRAWQKRIAYVPQMPFIADDSLRANVAFGVRQSAVDDKWVTDCLRLANLASLPDDLEQGLDTRLGERGMRLSGGQRQRIAIARALFNRPEILVLDEATSALDSLSEGEILAALQNLHGQVTTITIAHRLSTVAPCDEIFVLEAGCLVGQGSDAELRANHELFRRMAAAGV